MAAERALTLEERIWHHIGPDRRLGVDTLDTFLDGLAPARSTSLGLAQLVLLWRIIDSRTSASAADGARRAVGLQSARAAAALS